MEPPINEGLQDFFDRPDIGISPDDLLTEEGQKEAAVKFCSHAANLPPEYFRDIRTACEEGVSDEELQELTKIRAARDTDRARRFRGAKQDNHPLPGPAEQ